MKDVETLILCWRMHTFANSVIRYGRVELSDPRKSTNAITLVPALINCPNVGH